MRVHLRFLALAWFAPAFVADAQSPARPILTSLAAAEAEGRIYRSEPPPDSLPGPFRQSVTGTADRRCVAPREQLKALASPLDAVAVRSGDFVIGGMLSRQTTVRPGVGRKVWWAPMHNVWKYPDSLLVRAARIGTADTVRFKFAERGWAPGKKEEAFFPSMLKLPNPGTWLVVATAGPDWGCFIISNW